MRTSLESDILLLISGREELVIEATDGTETFVNNLVDNHIPVCIDSDVGLKGNYWKYDQSAESKPKTPVEVHEMVKNVTFEQMFESLGRPRQDLLLTSAQVKRFCKDHFRWLCRGGFTFFLSETGGEFIVGCVRLDVISYCQLRMGVIFLSSDNVRHPRLRDHLVVPK